MVFLRLNIGKTNIQNNLSNKAKGECPMGKAGKPNSLGPLQKYQEIMKLVSAAYFQRVSVSVSLMFQLYF